MPNPKRKRLGRSKEFKKFLGYSSSGGAASRYIALKVKPSYIIEGTKGQLISKCLLGVIVSTKIPTKKFDNFCPGGQIKKIKALYYTALGLFNIFGIIKFLI